MAPERATIMAMLVAACGSPLPSVAPVTVDVPPSLVSVVDSGPPLPPEVEGVVDVVKPATSCSVTPSGWEADFFWARYDNGRKTMPDLQGRVTAQFVIDHPGRSRRRRMGARTFPTKTSLTAWSEDSATCPSRRRRRGPCR